jgi:hypothetical protein
MPSFFEMNAFGLIHGAVAGFIWAKIQNATAIRDMK